METTGFPKRMFSPQAFVNSIHLCLVFVPSPVGSENLCPSVVGLLTGPSIGRL